MGEPEVFGNYFDDSIKEVDISLDIAIKACLQNGDTFADKVKAAYGKCFGNDYDFDELAAKSDSTDSDDDGLPDSFEGNEACFYKEMGWVAGSKAADDVIKADLVGLEASLKTEFDGNIDKCASWTGSFGSRRKREAGETENVEEVPSVMEKGNAALGWLRSAVRKTRSANPKKRDGKGKGKGEGKGKNSKGKKKGGNRRSAKKKNKNGKGKKKGGNRRSAKKKNKNGKGKGNGGKGGKGNRRSAKRKNKKGKGKGNGGKGGKGNSRSAKRKNKKGKGKGTEAREEKATVE